VPSRTKHPIEIRTPRRNLSQDMDILAAEMKKIRDELDDTRKMIDTLSRMFDEEKLTQRLDMRRLREVLKPLSEF
jgi:hypothetical protein